MIAAQIVVDDQIDVGIIVVRVLAELFFHVVELAAVGFDGRRIDEVIFWQLFDLIWRIDLNVRIGVVEFPVGFEETEFLRLAHGIDGLRRRSGLP